MNNIWESTTTNGSINPIDFGKHLRSGFTNNGYSHKNIVIRNKNLIPSMVPCSFTVVAYKWQEEGISLYNIGVRPNIYDVTHNGSLGDIKIFNWLVQDDAVFLVYNLVELFITEMGPKDCECYQLCEGALKCINYGRKP